MRDRFTRATFYIVFYSFILAYIYIDILLIISAPTDPVMSKRRRGQDLFSREAVIARLKEKSDVIMLIART